MYVLVKTSLRCFLKLFEILKIRRRQVKEHEHWDDWQIKDLNQDRVALVSLLNSKASTKIEKLKSSLLSISLLHFASYCIIECFKKNAQETLLVKGCYNNRTIIL